MLRAAWMRRMKKPARSQRLFFANADRLHAAGLEFRTKGTIVEMQHADFVACANKAAREQHELTLGAAVAEIADDEGDLHGCCSRE